LIRGRGVPRLSRGRDRGALHRPRKRKPAGRNAEGQDDLDRDCQRHEVPLGGTSAGKRGGGRLRTPRARGWCRSGTWMPRREWTPGRSAAGDRLPPRRPESFFPRRRPMVSCTGNRTASGNRRTPELHRSTVKRRIDAMMEQPANPVRLLRAGRRPSHKRAPSGWTQPAPTSCSGRSKGSSGTTLDQFSSFAIHGTRTGETAGPRAEQ